MNKGKVIEQTDADIFFKKPKTTQASKYIHGEILL
jgi:ABC-type phosphate transport system ATPase subunit